MYHRHREALEQVFGKGAGSSRNSPFFDITDESIETNTELEAQEAEEAGEHEHAGYRSAGGRRYLPARGVWPNDGGE